MCVLFGLGELNFGFLNVCYPKNRGLNDNHLKNWTKVLAELLNHSVRKDFGLK